jgi:hypothetical protein
MNSRDIFTPYDDPDWHLKTICLEVAETAPTRLIGYDEVKRRYISAKSKFRIAKADYDTCRSWCHKGGSWPKRTRDAKLRMAARARKCRTWQVLYERLRAKQQEARSNV